VTLKYKENQEYIMYLSSLIWPFIDAYWITLTFIIKFLFPKQSTIAKDRLEQRVRIPHYLLLDPMAC